MHNKNVFPSGPVLFQNKIAHSSLLKRQLVHRLQCLSSLNCIECKAGVAPERNSNTHHCLLVPTFYRIDDAKLNLNVDLTLTESNSLFNVGSSQKPHRFPAFLYPRYMARLLVGFRYHDNCWVSRGPYYVISYNYNFHKNK